MKRFRLKRRGIYMLPTLITTGNLVTGCLIVGFLFDRGAEMALTGAILILIAIALDVLDGLVARATNTTSRFGMELDSMADLVSFGVAPAWLAYVYCLKGLWPVGMAACVWYVTCAALRLARFNSESENRVSGFSGLPSPAAAATVASFVILIETLPRFTFIHLSATPEVMVAALAPWVTVAMGAIGWLMISHTPYLALKGVNLHRPRPLRLVFAAVIFGFIIWSFPQLLFAVLMIYIFTGIVAVLLTRVRWAEVVAPAWVAWAERMRSGKAAVAGQESSLPKINRLSR